MQRRFNALLLAVIAAVTIGAADDNDVAAAKSAEVAFHQECDKWYRESSKGIDTATTACRISQTYIDFVIKTRATRYRESVNNALLIPNQIAFAGAYDLEDGSKWSCVAGKGQSGLILSVWKREDWRTDRIPPNGIEASIGIEPKELLAKFTVEIGSWSNEKRDELKIPYHLGELSGTMTMQRTGSNWKVIPDRGTIGAGDRWKPAENAATTRPTN